MQSNAVILGGVALNIGVVDVLHSMGYFVIVVDYRENITLKSDLHILFDANDPNIAQELRKRNINTIDCVYTSMDEAGPAQRAICKEYGLCYAAEQAMINAHDKSLMHACWDKAGLLNRISFSLENFDAERLTNLSKDYKLIFKPSDSCGSKGITTLEKNSSSRELERAFQHAKEFSNNKKINIEEFIEGIEYSVEMLGDNYGNVAVFCVGQKYHTENTVSNKIANKVLYNSNKFSPVFLDKIAEISMKCYQAIGLKNTLGHLEIIQKNDGSFSPIEMGARSSSYIASHLVDVCANASFFKNFINVLHGGKIAHGLHPQSQNSSMFYFYDMRADKTAAAEYNITDFLPESIKSLYYDRSNLRKGNTFSLLKNDMDRYGYEILVGPGNILTIETVLEAEQKFYKEIFNE